MIKDFTNYRYEVRFLRAFYYFELIKRYHNVPFVLDVLTLDEANAVKPSSFEQIAKFIVDECSDLATLLPVNYQGFVDKETGRVTRGAAMALKSRVTLYMASPLLLPTMTLNGKQPQALLTNSLPLILISWINSLTCLVQPITRALKSFLLVLLVSMAISRKLISRWG